MADTSETGHAGRPTRSIVFTRASARAFRRMPKVTEDLIRDKLKQLAADPAALANNVRALKGGENRHRSRVGAYRALLTIEADRIVVHDVGPRGSIYR